MIYLDYNASTPLHPASAEAMARIQATVFGNPSSAHTAGRLARKYLEAARDTVARHLGATPEEVTFTSGATEANNLAVLGAVSPGCHCLSTMLEHHCVVEPLLHLAKHGHRVTFADVPTSGVLDATAFAGHATTETRFAAVQLVNHETGAIQPVAEIARLLPPHTHFHCDAAQAIGKLPVNFRTLGAHSLSVSAHKFGGPTGAGALVLSSKRKLAAMMFGGHQQRGQRPGTEAVALAVGLAAALEIATTNQRAHLMQLHILVEAFRAVMLAEVPTAVVNSPPDALPSTLNISFPGVRAELLLMALDLAGVACSTGSACSSGSLLPSPVLQAMHVGDARLQSAMRFSFGVTQSLAEVQKGAAHVAAAVRRLQATA